MPKNSKRTSAGDSAAEQSVRNNKQGKRGARTNRPKDPVKSKAGKASAAARKAKRENGDPVTRPCSARRTNGEPCKNSAIRGGTVCARHGGSAPQVRAKANQRLIEMVLPAMRELRKIIDSPDTADADKLKAINMVLNRTGYNERREIDLGLRTPTEFDALTRDAFRVVRGGSLREELEGMDDRPELPTPNDGSEGGVDEALEDFLAARERRLAREASTKLDNRGHDVIPGEVQREALDPFFREERERAEFARRRTEYDPRAAQDDPQREYEDRLCERVEETERRTGRKR